MQTGVKSSLEPIAIQAREMHELAGVCRGLMMQKKGWITAELLAAGLMTLGLAAFVMLSVKQSRRQREDALDDMLDDSFPASDPPSHSTFTSSG
jgi:hypothetical protein